MLKLSLGDARAYYLSTAKNELGVVSAQSIAGKLSVTAVLDYSAIFNSLMQGCIMQ
jgi:exosome complex RNA-binding protein Csl4